MLGIHYRNKDRTELSIKMSYQRAGNNLTAPLCWFTTPLNQAAAY